MSAAGGRLVSPASAAPPLLGPVFGTACLLATLSGVVVLAVLLGSIVARRSARPPPHPWYAVGDHISDLGIVPLGWPRSRSRATRSGGVPGRDRGQPLAARPCRVLRNPGRGRRRRSSSRNTPRPGGSPTDHPDEHRQPGRRAVDRLRYPRPGAVRAGLRVQGLALGPTLWPAA